MAMVVMHSRLVVSTIFVNAMIKTSLTTLTQTVVMEANCWSSFLCPLLLHHILGWSHRTKINVILLLLYMYTHDNCAADQTHPQKVTAMSALLVSRWIEPKNKILFFDTLFYFINMSFVDGLLHNIKRVSDFRQQLLLKESLWKNYCCYYRLPIWRRILQN